MATQQLLSRQAELVREQLPAKPIKPRIITKTSAEIKQENYDLRHKKSFVRVLKMHSVMPKDLAQITEPPKLTVKEWNYDVDQSVRKIVSQLRRKRKDSGLIVASSSSESDQDDAQSSDTDKNQRSLKAAVSASRLQNRMAAKKSASSKAIIRRNCATAQNSNKIKVNTYKVGARKKQDVFYKDYLDGSVTKIDAKARDRIHKLEAGLNPSYRDKSWRVQKVKDSKLEYPQGAVVRIDNKARQQIEQLENGQKISASVMQEAFRQGLLTKVQHQTAKNLQDIRRQLSLLKVRPDKQAREKAQMEYIKAAKAQKHASKMKGRPCDRIHVIERRQSVSSTGSHPPHEVGHSHFVKMTFDELPDQLQEKVLSAENSKEYAYGQGRNGSADSFSISLGTRASTSAELISFKTQKTNKRNKYVSNKLQSKPQTAIDTIKGDEVEASVTLKSQLTKIQRASISKNIKLRKKDSEFRSDILKTNSSLAEETEGVEKSNEVNFDTKAQSLSVVRRKNASIMQQQRGDSRASEGQTKQNTVAYSGGYLDGIYARNENMGRQNPYSQQTSVKNTLMPGHCHSLSNSKQSRARNDSLSNISTNQYKELTKRMDKKRRVQTGVAPMRSEIIQTEVPKRLSNGSYLVRQNFVYQQPLKYRIEFCRPALFASGCLTCGNENAKVENYDERYCCATCQKTLQTPTGEQVTLRQNHDGSKIVGQAWKYSKLIKSFKVNVDDLRIRGGHKCHATFAGEKGDIIVLLDEVNSKYIFA